MIYGTKGYTNCQNKIWDNDGNLIWEYEYPLDDEGRPTNRVAISSYDEEHINFVTAIRTNTPLNQAHDLAAATLVGVMGRESAITGKLVTYEEMLTSNLRLGPLEYKWQPVNIKAEPPIPGISPDITRVRGV
jgi:myo-inositol 2-dehydrogenase / D-chiro-inositol 1-dehydrogenase